jgi:predicted ABC-type transport system involved in lysophospholipase L1 biosynthesis ATPase subunit
MDTETLAQFRNRNLGFVFQFHHLLPEFTALENIMMPALIADQPFDQAQRRAISLLEQFGIPERAEHRPTQLSGGEQQRVAMARALMNNPDLLLADEPTGNLDSETGRTIEELLFDLNKANGTTLVLVSHDLSLAEQCQRIIRLKNGRIFKDEWIGSSEVEQVK